METKEINTINTKKIFQLANNLEKISKYIKHKEIVNWAKEDINEIYYIQKTLKEERLLEKAFTIKETINIKISKTKDIEKRIFEVYTIINKELNSWRDVNLKINI